MPGSFAIYLALPFLFTLLIFGMGRFVGGSNASAYFAIRTGTTNILVYEMLGSAIWMTSWVVVEDVGVSLRNEQVSGTLEQNFLAPIDRATLLVGMSLADIVITTVIFVIAVGVTVALTMPTDIVALLQAYLMLLIGLVPLFGICFLFAGIIIKFKEPYVFVQIVNVLFAVLTGTYYPVALLPFWIQCLSGFLPQTYVIENMRQIILANRNLVSLYGNVFVLFALALAYPTVGYTIFKRIERKASVTGEFSKY
jgi:ABC-2 type transport system permease protein